MFCAGELRINAAVIRVSASQTNNIPDGGSWATAFPVLQQAITAANDGDEVWVAAGTFRENITLKAGVALYGGFGGAESALNQRNWTTNLTILDGRQTNSVVVIAAGTASTRVDGFTVRNGRASFGGGILCSNASPTIVNNFIVQNYSTIGGGGVQCIGGSPTVAFNLIQGNSAQFGGGGVDCTGSEAGIHNNRIIGNSSPGTFNSAGGIACRYLPASEIYNNLIAGNMVDKLSSVGSGGIAIYGGCPARVINNTIVWNTGPPAGSAITSDTNSAFAISGHPVIANNIIAFNASGIRVVGEITFQNNCVFGDLPYQGIPDPTGTNGNIAADPGFVPNEGFVDVHLSAQSPCRDAGNSALISVNATDLGGDARILGTDADIGADEFNGTEPSFTPMIVRVSTSGDDSNNGSSWSMAKKTVQAAIDQATINGGEVWVKAGTYHENLILRHSVHLYGGFAGIETDVSQRDWGVNVTVLDGQQSGSVIIIKDLLHWNTVNGFVIRNGEAGAGAGIYCFGSSPVIVHNVISNNVATTFNLFRDGVGGGIYCASDASPVIRSNAILFNRAFFGGGICSTGFRSLPLITNNRFEANVAAVRQPTSANGSGGGGFYALDSSKPTIVNNYFLNNITTNAPGSFNAGEGGAICLDSSTTAQILNNTLVGNRATSTVGFYLENGGGIFSRSSGSVIADNIIAFGSSGISAVRNASDTRFSKLQNNCVYGNSSNYLRMPDLTGTNGNISFDPLLVSNNDASLNTNSPCINAGNNDYATDSPDLIGNPRISGGIVDIGSVEVQNPSSILSYAWLHQFSLALDGSADYADPDADGANNWLEWQGGSVPTNAASVPIPVITAQPAGTSQPRGVNVTFQIGVTSITPVSFQWQFNNDLIVGATNSSYTITNVQAFHAGNFSVIVTNNFGAAISSNAPLELGHMASWGLNNFGQATVPFRATNITAVAAGDSFNVWLKSDGSLLGWGLNAYGQLTFPDNSIDVAAIAAGYQSTLTLLAGGTVVAYGRQSQADVPPFLANVVAVMLGEYHSLALTADGKVIAWGWNGSGQTSVPSGLSNVVAIAAGGRHSLALKSDGTVVAWGEGLFGQTNVPAGLSDAVAISAGAIHSLALKSDGTVVSWGSSTPAAEVPAGLTNVVAISCGDGHCLALQANGIVVAWGRNESGQTNVPSGLTNVVSISSGHYHNLAVVGEGPPLIQAPITDLLRDASGFSVSIPTQSGRVYRLEYKDSVADADWHPLPLVAGDGADKILTDPGATNSQRFYRVRCW